jgi:hypothetical protein
MRPAPTPFMIRAAWVENRNTLFAFESIASFQSASVGFGVLM